MAVMQVKETARFITTKSMAYGNQTNPSKKEVFVRQFADFRQIARNHLNQNLKVTINTITDMKSVATHTCKEKEEYEKSKKN